MSHRPRVLILVKGLNAGGAEMLIAQMVEQPEARRVDYEVAYVRADMAALAPRISARVPVHCLGSTSDSDLSWLPRLRGLLRRSTPPFQIVHGHLASSAAVGRLVARSLPGRDRPRLVYTEHSSWPHLDPRTKALMYATAHLDDASFAVSAANRQLLPRTLRHRYQVLHHGIDLDRFRAGRPDPGTRTELGIPADHVLVVTAASHTQQKDYPTLLAATQLLRDLPVTVVAAGSGPLTEILTARHRQLALGERFRFLGRRDDIPALLQAADIFVLASAWESMPVAVMEALATGLPSVVTAVGELPHVLRPDQDVFMVTPGSPDRLAAALRRLVEDPELRQALGLAAAEASAKFDVRTTLSTLEDTYLRLAS